MTNAQAARRRTVVANISLSLDGHVTGPGGEYDMGWVAGHAVSDGARSHMVTVTGTATTALLGRRNYEGFAGFWPGVAGDEGADPRDRAFARWLDDVEKVVFSTTLDRVAWNNARLAPADPAATVKRLRELEGGDIIVLGSAAIIRQLLAAGEVDRLSITLCPEVSGGGARLFEDGIGASSWTLAASGPTGTGALCLLYDRVPADLGS